MASKEYNDFSKLFLPELANLLRVEYVVKSILSVSEKGSTTYNSDYSTAKLKSNDKATAWNFGTSSTTAQFKTNVDMYLYNDSGEMVFSKSKESFWPTDDAYPMTLKYLLKRMPIYTK